MFSFNNLSRAQDKTPFKSTFWAIYISTILMILSAATTCRTAHAEDYPSNSEETDTKKKEDTDTAAQRTGRDEKILERITVVGSSKKISEVPGSAALLEGPELEQAKTGLGDITRALRTAPGLNVVEEEGYGLRPNIGMRGTPSERSNSITLMEDGVLISPAPHSAPAAYYFPSFARMAGVEVLKGAGQIKYGPRTTGGSLNLLSTAIPDQFTLKGNLATGSHDTTRGHVYLGESFENFGYLLETLQIVTDGFKDLDGGGNTGFDLQDYVGKIRFNTNRDNEVYQQLQFKFGYYEQDSNETYLGLSREDFGNTPNRGERQHRHHDHRLLQRYCSTLEQARWRKWPLSHQCSTIRRFIPMHFLT